MAHWRAGFLALSIVAAAELEGCTFGQPTNNGGSGGTTADASNDAPSSNAGGQTNSGGAGTGGHSNAGGASSSGGVTSSNGGAPTSGGAPSSGGAGNASNGGAGNASNGGATTGGGGGSGGLDASTNDGSLDAGPDTGVTSPCGPCPSGLCLDGGRCAECAGDGNCSAPMPRCELASHTCVACLPGPGDNCADGTYCDSGSLTCVRGCRDDSTCASGSCDIGHDCDRCVTDDECAAPLVCATGTCMAACQTTQDCPSGYTCCGTRCADLKHDHGHCAACDTACAEDYCGATGCKSDTVANICDVTTVTVLLDSQTVDEGLAPAVAAAFTAKCASHPQAQVVSQTASLAVNPTTGRPVSNGTDILVTIGGSFGQKLVGYLDSAGISPAYAKYFFDPGDTDRFYVRAQDGGADPFVLDTPNAGLDATHDFFVIETAVDPISGSRVVEIYGLFSPGTAAGEWFFENRVLPNLGTFTHRYYIYEWSHGDAGPLPGSADSFTLRASGD